MPNITLSIPKEIYERMKQYPEIKWSEVVRRAIIEYLKKLESPTVMSSEEIAKELGEEFIRDLSKINIEGILKSYDEMRRLEWKRLSTTQAT